MSYCNYVMCNCVILILSWIVELKTSTVNPIHLNSEREVTFTVLGYNTKFICGLECDASNYNSIVRFDKNADSKTLSVAFQSILLRNMHTKLVINIHGVDLRQKNTEVLVALSNSFNNNVEFWRPRIIVHVPFQTALRDKGEEVVINELHQFLIEVAQNHSIRFPIDSEVFISYKTNYNLFLWEIYNFKNVYKVQRINTPFAIMNCDNEMLVNINPISVRRQNMTGIKIAAVAQNDPDYQPRMKMKIYINGTAEFISGMCLTVFESIIFMLGFSYTALDGKGWMGLYPNGTWTGMSGQVVRGEADISIAQASTILMTDQLHGITFLHSTSNGRLVAIFRQPSASSIRDIIISAFEFHVWIYFGLGWTVLLISLQIFFRIILAYEIASESDGQFLGESVWWAISTTCFISWHMTPNSFSIRFIFILGVVMALLIYIGFSASLITNLCAETLPIKSFADLSESNLDIAADKWLTSAHEIAQDVYRWRKMGNVPQNHFLQLESAVPKILNKPLAFVTSDDAVGVVFRRLNYPDAYFCNTVDKLIASMVRSQTAMFIKRKSPLKEILNPKILLMFERGDLSRMNRRYEMETIVLCTSIKHQYRGGLSMKDVSTPFVVLSMGFVSSIIAYLIERKFRKRHRRFLEM